MKDTLTTSGSQKGLVRLILVALLFFSALMIYWFFGRNTVLNAPSAVPLVYHAEITSTEAMVAGKDIPLDIQIFDQFDHPVTDFEQRTLSRVLYNAYIAVVSRDLSSFQAYPIYVPFNPMGGGGMSMGGPTTTPIATPQNGETPATEDLIKLQPEVVFPRDGQYTVFVDVLPRGGQIVTLPVLVSVGSQITQLAALAPDTSLTQSINSLNVTLKPDQQLKAGEPVNINFEVVDAQGQIISNLIGGLSGHQCVAYAVDEKLTTFLRTNLVDPNQLQFWVTFPKAGKYKVWFEFLYESKFQQVAFVVNVQ